MILLQGSTFSDLLPYMKLPKIKELILKRNINLHETTKELGWLKDPVDREAVRYNRETDHDLLEWEAKYIKENKKKDLPF